MVIFIIFYVPDDLFYLFYLIEESKFLDFIVIDWNLAHRALDGCIWWFVFEEAIDTRHANQMLRQANDIRRSSLKFI